MRFQVLEKLSGNQELEQRLQNALRLYDEHMGQLTPAARSFVAKLFLRDPKDQMEKEKIPDSIGSDYKSLSDEDRSSISQHASFIERLVNDKHLLRELTDSYDQFY
ncbi:unnamed protein product, partial [Mesorhabditis spiculigera]